MILRIQGFSYRQIGKELKISHEQARNDVKNILQQTLDNCRESVEELRQLENERLDQLWAKFFQMAIDDGDLHAAHRCISISKSRRELNGLDMPQRAPVDEAGRAAPERINIKKILNILDAETAKKISRAHRSSIAEESDVC